MSPRPIRLGVFALAVASSLLLSGCPLIGPQCPSDRQLCDGTCVDVRVSDGHCGACGVTCEEGDTCSASACVPCVGGSCETDAVAACFNSGHVVAVNAAEGSAAAPVEASPNPSRLAELGEVILLADGFDQQLHQLARDGLTPYDAPLEIAGAEPQDLLVDGEHVYVVDGLGESLIVVKRGERQGDGRYALSVVEQLSFTPDEGDPAQNPHAAARLGDTLYVTLFDGAGVAKVSVADPTALVWSGTVDLSGVDLAPYDAEAGSLPRPDALVVHQGALWMVLNNLTANWEIGGPGILVRLDPADDSLQRFSLGDACLNPGGLLPLEEDLVVACGGRVEYTPEWESEIVEGAGVVRVGLDGEVKDRWSAICEAADEGCENASPRALAWANELLLVGDQASGRVFVLEPTEDGLSARFGLEAAVDACPASGFSSVFEILATP